MGIAVRWRFKPNKLPSTHLNWKESLHGARRPRPGRRRRTARFENRPSSFLFDYTFCQIVHEATT